ncbi:MAG: hypothetical protein KDA61_11110 [Planctomycetales bacterium]|nr:hypothetical protein [Planctomycetales bacterium]
MYRPRFSIRILLAAATAAALFAFAIRYPRPWLPPVLVGLHVFLSVGAMLAALASVGSRRLFFAAWAFCATVWTWTFYDAQGIVPVASSFQAERYPPQSPRAGSPLRQRIWFDAAEYVARRLPAPDLKMGATVLAPTGSLRSVFGLAPRPAQSIIDEQDADLADNPQRRGADGTPSNWGTTYWDLHRIDGRSGDHYTVERSSFLYAAAALRPVHDVPTIARTLKAGLGFPFAWLGATFWWCILGRQADAAAKGATTEK